MDEYHALALASGPKPKVGVESLATTPGLSISMQEIWPHDKGGFRIRVTHQLTNVLTIY